MLFDSIWHYIFEEILFHNFKYHFSRCRVRLWIFWLYSKYSLIRCSIETPNGDTRRNMTKTIHNSMYYVCFLLRLQEKWFKYLQYQLQTEEPIRTEDVFTRTVFTFECFNWQMPRPTLVVELSHSVPEVRSSPAIQRVERSKQKQRQNQLACRQSRSYRKSSPQPEWACTSSSKSTTFPCCPGQNATQAEPKPNPKAKKNKSKWLCNRSGDQLFFE